MTPAQRAQVRKDGPGKRKFQNKYHGPYTVEERVGNVSFRIKLPATCRAHPVIHADALKVHKPHGIAAFEPEPLEPLFLEDDDGVHEYFEIAAILGSRRRPKKRPRRTEYLVEWRGYPMEQAQWVPFARLPPYWQAHLPAHLLTPLTQERT
jgi:hypothetical protein